MRGRGGDGLRPGEVVLEPGALGLLLRAHVGAQDAFRPEKAADTGAGAGVVVDPLGDEVARALQRGVDRGDVKILGHRASLGRDVAGGLARGIDGRVLPQDDIGERFEPSLSGDRRPRAAPGPERQVHVFERRERLGGVEPGPQRFRQEMTLQERGGDRLAAVVQDGELSQAVADGGDGHLVQRPGCFLAIAGDERDGRPVGQEGSGGADLRRPER